MGDLERWLSPYGIAAAAISWLVRWLLRRRKVVQVVTPSRTRRLYRFLLRTGLSTVTLHGLIEEMGLDPTSPDAVELARRWIHEHRWCEPSEDAPPSGPTVNSASPAAPQNSTLLRGNGHVPLVD